MDLALQKTTDFRRILRRLALVWLEPQIDTSDKDWNNLSTQLLEVADTVDLCTDVDQCIDLCTNFEAVQVLLIIPARLARSLLPLIADIPHLRTVYVLGDEASLPKDQLAARSKVRGVCSSVHAIGQMIRQNIKQQDHNAVSISVLSPSVGLQQNLNELEPLFMYSRLLKEILFNMDRHLHTKERFVQFLRDQYCHNPTNLALVDEFESDYRPTTAVWWYTRGCFLFQMLNEGLRVMDSDLIIRMSFFLCDLHQQLVTLRDLQPLSSIPSTLYRGQGMSRSDFEKVRNSLGGLLSFNAFTSTSADEEVSCCFCPIPPQDPDTVPVLFEMSLEPRLPSTTFALLNGVSYYAGAEQEVLFTMHTVFRIANVEWMGDVLWRVKLILTNDEDPALKLLGERIQEETAGSTGWTQLGQLLPSARRDRQQYR